MSQTSNSSSGGVGFCGLLTIVFVTLKLLGKITWSWWCVLSPIWGSVALLLAIFAVLAIIALLMLLWESVK